MGGQVTTVVMTRDRWPDLRDTLPLHEGPVVLVDNGSTDGTAERVRAELPHVRVLALGHNLGAVARNLGVAVARTPYVAFADDDSWWERGSLDLAADAFARHPRLGLVAGTVLVAPDGRPDPVTLAMRRAPLGRAGDLPGPKVLGFLACGAVVRREAFLAVGGFDPVLFFLGEEQRVAADLAAAGWGLAHVPEVVAWHRPSAARSGADARAALVARNQVLTAVLRRPLPVVARTALAALRQGPVGRRGVRDAVRRLPEALRHRQLLPLPVERDLRRLEEDAA